MITITKGKLLKGDKIEVEYQKQNEGESKPAECSEKHKTAPHPDLKQAFARLDIHAALLGEFVPLVQVKDINKVDEAITGRFHVSGFTRVGIDDDDEGVILTAQKTLNSGKMLGFNTPITRFNDVSETVYPYTDELIEACEKVVAEMELYLGGKYAPEPQLALKLKTEDEEK